MAEGSYVRKGIAVAAAAAFLIGVATVYFASTAPRRPHQLKVIQVECLNVERGPKLQFAGGIIHASGAPVGKYKFLPAVPGKYGPRIEVRGIAVRQAHGRVIIEPGTQDWFWPFLNDDAVQIFYYRLNSVVARRCIG